MDYLSKSYIDELISIYDLEPKYGYVKKDNVDDRHSSLDFYEPTDEDFIHRDKKQNGIVLNKRGEEINIYKIKNRKNFFLYLNLTDMMIGVIPKQK